MSLAHAFLLGSLSWHRHSPGTFFQQGLNARERTSSRWVCLRIAILMGKDGDSPGSWFEVGDSRSLKSNGGLMIFGFFF